MTEITGIYGTAKVFSDVIDTRAEEQILELMNQPFMENAHVRMMPDVHAGTGCTVGTTLRIQDKACPNLVGVDIGCGMLTVRLPFLPDLQKLDEVIHRVVPAGMNVHEEKTDYPLDHLKCIDQLHKANHILQSVGTLGGGNHFIEVDSDQDGDYYLVIHSGSRYLGKSICEIYMDIANDECNDHKQETLDQMNQMIAKMRNEDRGKEIPAAIKAFKQSVADRKPLVPRDLAYVSGQSLDNYLHDMDIAADFAVLNRNTIARSILREFEVDFDQCENFTTIHNYIDTENMILRKGSISAQKGETVLIPLNMRDGSIIGVGKGNEDWNYSGPHGAGRAMSRAKAKETLTLEAYQKEMHGIYSTSVNLETIDEAPMAYKKPKDIVPVLKDSVEITKLIKPLYNFKASEDGYHRKDRNG